MRGRSALILSIWASQNDIVVATVSMILRLRMTNYSSDFSSLSLRTKGASIAYASILYDANFLALTPFANKMSSSS
jgi:hypothetical protein